ncbi:MAG: serine hydrolase [Acidimicrobiales bacterium]|nr:serine hydrolase [Acidimicrobiales bacterium]
MTAEPELPDALVPLPSQPEDVPWPTEEWPRCSAADAGVDEARLEALLDELCDGEHPLMGRTFAAAVVVGGRLVAERYGMWPVRDLRALEPNPPLEPIEPSTRLLSWSMAKSITSLAVGVAVGDGAISLDDPVADPHWQAPGDPRSAITWDDLLTMRPGLAWTEEYYDLDGDVLPDVVTMLFGDGAPDMAAFAADKELVNSPGSPEAYAYSSGTTNIVSAALARTLGLDRDGMECFLRERVLEPIGVRDADLRFDEAGTFIGSSYAYLTLLDWCRFGLLAIRGGVWDGRRVVPEGWIDHGRRARSPEEGDKFHGAHWWSWALPDGRFAAHGFEGQRVVCHPTRDVVCVRLGKTGAEGAQPLTDHLAEIALLFPRL